jgi:uncharacterized protein YbaR (Trm112 family)/glycosyltransferase involved in cell wall biosynthesis
MPDAACIAWFTPLRPIASGISNYNEELLSVLGQSWSIDVFVDGYTPEPFQSFGNLRIFPAREFERRDKRQRYACVVYQFGNSPAHAYMYDVALRRPGVVVLHDTVLHHLMLSMVLRRGGAARYRMMMGERYGEEGRFAAERVLQGRMPRALFDYPLSEALIERSNHVIVHSAFSRNQILGWLPSAAVSVVPMGIRVPPLISHKDARAELNLAADAFVVASITLVNPYKRLDVVMRTLSRLQRRRPVYMLVAGSVSPHVPLQRWIALYGLEGVVETLGFVDDRQARIVAAAADVLVNLRYPTAGETSASLLRIMAARRPVLVSDAGSFQELPDDVVAKVPVDALEEETVEALFEAFAGRDDLPTQLGANARAFIEREHSLNQMVAGYARILRNVIGLDLQIPPLVEVKEEIDLHSDNRNWPIDPTIDAAAKAMLELGLAGDARLLHDVAEAVSDLGISPAKMEPDGALDGWREGNRELDKQETKPISDELLEILACPVCKTAVRLEESKLVCDNCGRRYRIEDGIPIMLVDEAEMPTQD